MKVAVYTLGCKVNTYESEYVIKEFLKRGYTLTDFSDSNADVYLINTCTVTNTSDQKSRKMIRQARAKNKDAVVVAMGCFTQIRNNDNQIMDFVDVVIGNKDKSKIVDLTEDYIKNKQKISKIEDINEADFDDMEISYFNTRTRALVKIEDGCENFCSYCIIPYVRGRERSRKPEDIVAEVKKLASEGVVEVMLLGQNVNSYGKNLEQPMTFAALLREAEKVEGLKRIRFMTSHPKDLSDELIEVMKESKKICPHFHLPLQSGSSAILKKMNRHYTKERYLELVRKLRAALPDISLTTDIIVGFPGETEEDFEESYEFVKKIHFYETHIFKYSRRHGTKAASMDGQLTEAAKAQRSDRMLELHEIRAREYEEAMIGKKMELLLEEEIEIDGRPWYVGHSKEYVRAVISKTDAHRVNDLVTVKAVAFVRDHILETKEV